MSWQDNRLDASFRGVMFEVLRIQDSVSRDHADHEYPNIDGADVHDLGRKARTFRLTAIIRGEDYDTRLMNFLVELDKPGYGELVHPVYGAIPKVQLTEYQVSHEADNLDNCTLELTFLESVTGTNFITVTPEQHWWDAILNALDDLNDKLAALYDAVFGPYERFKGLLNKGKTALSALQNTLIIMRGGVAGTLRDTQDFLDYPGRYINELGEILDTRSLVAGALENSPLRHVAGVVAVTFTPQGGALTPTASLLNAGSRAADSTSPQIQTLTPVLSAWKADAATMTTMITLPEALVKGTQTAVIAMPATATVADIADVTVLHTGIAAMKLVQNAVDILSTPAVTEVLSPDDIETIADVVRAGIQQAITAIRTRYQPATATVSADTQPVGLLWLPVVEQLRNVALGVQVLAEQVISRRPPLTIRTVKQDTCLHLLAHQWYGDYSRAGELLRLNPGLRNPNAIKKGDRLHAYSR
ncbi:DNA circularization N-terminal domain-containing protein [Salmonella enterica]|nr:DNA circularization N-terminal domain-containing protein [Salmonella enterica]EIV7028013.1 DNA circularization N-terminal domain-containing protein [Salmonella enterica]EIW3704214.1 DNA circularization N-terminal domain-containing protein [Salmonella enterica]